jgi:RNA polymerase sigma-54 factor
MVNAARLLELQSAQLQDLINEELLANPALQQIEAESLCSSCSGPIHGGVCQRCFGRSWEPAGHSENLNDLDAAALVAQPWSLFDSLLTDLRASLPADEHHIAVALVGSLDRRGMLTESCADIGSALNIPAETIERVLRLLRELGPPGIASRNLQESLLAQLDQIPLTELPGQHTRLIIERHFDDLANGRFSAVAASLGVSLDDVEATRRFVQLRLQSSPASSFWPEEREEHHFSVAPDVVVDCIDGALTVELLHSPIRWLRVDPLYQQLSAQPDALTAEELLHVQAFVKRSIEFLRNLHTRESTVRRVANLAAGRQRQFLCAGILPLHAVTRRELANELGLHESTVGRAIDNKFVLFPDHNLWKFSDLLGGPRVAESILHQMLRHPSEPMTDEQLAEELTRRGYPIARRTVAKYRQRMGFTPVAHRAIVHGDR